MPLPAPIFVVTKALALLICGAAAIYGMLGVLQAGSIYGGLRALWNANLWSGLVFASVVGAGLIAFPRMALSEPRPGVPRACYFWLAIAASATWPLVTRLIAFDTCLDAGGSFDSVQGQCSMSTSYPHVGIHRTHGVFIVIVAISLTLAITVFVSSKLSPKPSPSAA
jgi:hypothetical protein